MVVSLADYHVLVSIHRPLGIAILILVVVRFVNRQLNPPPPFPRTMSALERRVATASELVMYALMAVLPLVGWGMLSAARIRSSCSGRCICRSSCRTTRCSTRPCGGRTPSSRTSSS
jgi:cytochrome b561